MVRDLKIIEGATGPFVAMPSRKLTAHCPHCRCKNHLRAAYCNQCGTRLREQRTVKDDEGRAKLYADIAHPINSACREMIQQRVIEAFQEEKVAVEAARLRAQLRRFRPGRDARLATPLPPAVASGRRDDADPGGGKAARPAQSPHRPTPEGHSTASARHLE